MSGASFTFVRDSSRRWQSIQRTTWQSSFENPSFMLRMSSSYDVVAPPSSSAVDAAAANLLADDTVFHAVCLSVVLMAPMLALLVA